MQHNCATSFVSMIYLFGSEDEWKQVLGVRLPITPCYLNWIPPFYKGPRTQKVNTVKTVGRKESMHTGQQVLSRQTRTSVHSFHDTNAVRKAVMWHIPDTIILTRATKRYHKHHSVTFITAMQSNQDTGDKLTTP